MSDSPTETLVRAVDTVELARYEQHGGEPSDESALNIADARRLPGRLKGTPAFGQDGWTASVSAWAGLALVVVGFAEIIYSWFELAGMLSVALKMLYVVSEGKTGLALIIIGVGVVDMGVRRQDRAEREQQLAQMRQVHTELRSAVGPASEHARDVRRPG